MTYYNSNGEKYDLPDRRKHGCDSCYQDVPTQLFLGFNRDMIWLCGKCYSPLIKGQKKKHKLSFEYKNEV